jgi:hypothetical protein
VVSITLPTAAVEGAGEAIAGRAGALRIQEGFALQSLTNGPVQGVIRSLLATLDAVLPMGNTLVDKLLGDDVLLRAAAVMLDPNLLSQEPSDLRRHRERRGRADFDELIDHIRANLDQPLRLSDLEARKQFSRWALQEAFRQRLDATPMEWIRGQARVPCSGVIPPAPPPRLSRGGPLTSGDRLHG